MNAFVQRLKPQLDLADGSEHVIIRRVAIGGNDAAANWSAAGRDKVAIAQNTEIPVAERLEALKSVSAPRLKKFQRLFDDIAAADELLAKTKPTLDAPSAADATFDAALVGKAATMSAAERLQMSERMELAIARAPRELSGLPAEAHARAVENTLHRQKPDEMTRWQSDRMAVDAARQALRLAVERHRQDIGLGAAWPKFANEIGAKAFATLG
jgi:hypothetical protein